LLEGFKNTASVAKVLEKQPMAWTAAPHATRPNKKQRITWATARHAMHSKWFSMHNN
jgi:hypothetical protein